MIKEKRGISDVIATVMIILITVAGIGLLAAVLIPFVTKNMSEVTRCLDIEKEISFVQESSCYNATSYGVNSTRLKIRFGKINISEMLIYLETNGEVKAISIKNGQTANLSSSAKILNSSYGTTLYLPAMNGGERTYIINNTISKTAKVAAVVKGQPCGISDDTILDECRG